MTRSSIGSTAVLILAIGTALTYVHADPDDRDVDAAATYSAGEREGEDESAEPSEFELLASYRDVAFDHELAGMLAITTLADIDASTEQRVETLGDILNETKSLGFRNALRVTLAEVLLNSGETEKAVDHLRAIIAENDARLVEDEESDDDE